MRPGRGGRGPPRGARRSSAPARIRTGTSSGMPAIARSGETSARWGRKTEATWARTFDNLCAKIDNVEAVEDKVPRGKFPKVTRRVGKSPPQYAEDDEQDLSGRKGATWSIPKPSSSTAGCPARDVARS